MVENLHARPATKCSTPATALSGEGGLDSDFCVEGEGEKKKKSVWARRLDLPCLSDALIIVVGNITRPYIWCLHLVATLPPSTLSSFLVFVLFACHGLCWKRRAGNVGQRYGEERRLLGGHWLVRMHICSIHGSRLSLDATGLVKGLVGLKRLARMGQRSGWTVST